MDDLGGMYIIGGGGVFGSVILVTSLPLSTNLILLIVVLASISHPYRSYLVLSAAVESGVEIFGYDHVR